MKYIIGANIFIWLFICLYLIFLNKKNNEIGLKVKELYNLKKDK
ncbi:CcmD family protein [Desulfonauticus submarinus]